MEATTVTKTIKPRRQKRSGTIRLLESGLWQSIARPRGQPVQSKTFFNKEDGERWLRDIYNAVDKGAFVSTVRAERMTFDDLADDFEKDFAPHHYRGAAWKSKLKSLRKRLGSYSLVAIVPQAVAGYRDQRLRDPDPRYKKNVGKAPRISPATVKSELDLLAKILDVAQKEFGIPLPAGNPVSSIRLPRPGKGRERRLVGDEWQRLERECRASGNRWLWLAVQLAVETAMRQGELLQLLWKHVDKKARVALLVDKDKIKNATPRAVPLSSRSLAVLEAMPRSTTGRVIPLDRMTLYKAFQRACARAGIADFRWHDLRHESLSRLAERGDLSIRELAEVSGHKTLQMLMRYTHIQASRLAAKIG